MKTKSPLEFMAPKYTRIGDLLEWYDPDTGDPGDTGDTGDYDTGEPDTISPITPLDAVNLYDFDELSENVIAEGLMNRRFSQSGAINTSVYAPFIPGADEMSPEAIKRAAEDAAVEDYFTTYAETTPSSSSSIEIDGESGERRVYEDGAVFLVVPADDPRIVLRQENEEQ